VDVSFDGCTVREPFIVAWTHHGEGQEVWQASTDRLEAGFTRWGTISGPPIEQAQLSRTAHALLVLRNNGLEVHGPAGLEGRFVPASPWFDFDDGTAARNTSNCLNGQQDNYSVTCVTGQEAQDYVAWLNKKTGGNYRMLTEAEREYASRPYYGGEVAMASGSTVAVWSLNPDTEIALIIKAARTSTWGDVDRQAVLITLSAAAVPPGDRPASRRATEMGLAALRARRAVAAVVAFEQARSLDPSDIEASVNYGYALALAGRKMDAQTVLSSVLLRDPTSEVAWTAFGETLSEDVPNATAAFKLALHFANSRERTLARFREMAQNHPDSNVREIAADVLAEREGVPAAPEGLH
jgi:hypothetical protein